MSSAICECEDVPPASAFTLDSNASVLKILYYAASTRKFCANNNFRDVTQLSTDATLDVLIRGPIIEET